MAAKMTIQQAAKHLGVSTAVVERWIREGRVWSSREPGRRRHMIDPIQFKTPAFGDMLFAHKCFSEARRKIQDGVPISQLGHEGWYTREEVALLFAVSPETVDLWRRENRITCKKFDRHRLYQTETSLALKSIRRGDLIDRKQVAELLDCEGWRVDALAKQGRLKTRQVTVGALKKRMFPRDQFTIAALDDMKEHIRKTSRGGIKVGSSGYFHWPDGRIMKRDRDCITAREAARRMAKNWREEPEIHRQLYRWADKGRIDAVFHDGDYWIAVDDASLKPIEGLDPADAAPPVFEDLPGSSPAAMAG